MRRASRNLMAGAGCAVVLFSGCSTGNEAEQPRPTTQSGVTSSVTSTVPEAEPATAAERRWVNRVHRIRPRIDKAFQRDLTITRASMESLVRVLGTCKATLRDAGQPGDRFVQAALVARKGCEHYELSAKHFQEAIAVSDVSGAVVAGTPEETAFDRALGQAFAAQANGSNAMIRAEEKADQLLADITAEASG
jgi:hypothetical protein